MLKFMTALIAGKLALIFSKLLGSGRGSSLPGLLALRLDPDFLKRLAPKPRLGTIMVVGTNGKTTTANMLTQILTTAGYKIIANQQGANLPAGIATVYVRHSSLWRRKIDSDYAVLEVDEAAFALVTKTITPQLLLVTNFFPDQLDRYGSQQDMIRGISDALQKLPQDTTLVLNGDDPQVAHLAITSKLTAKFYGLQLNAADACQPLSQAIPTLCPACGDLLHYQQHIYGHLGYYQCPQCTLSRPAPDVTAIDVNTTNYIQGVISAGAGNISVTVTTPGLHNLYNALAAFTVAHLLQIKPDLIKQGLLAYTPATGRTEYYSYADKQITLILVKNAMGFNQALFNLPVHTPKQQILIAINNQPADGKDVSWLWDVDWETWAGHSDIEASFICSGQKAPDVALCLKYADIPNTQWQIEPDLNRAVAMALQSDSETVTMLVNYSALAPVAKQLTKRAKRVKLHDHHHVSSVS